MSAADIARDFAVSGEILAAEPLYTGHIHDSFVVSVASPEGHERFLLQRINERVFPRPHLVMENIARVTAHLRNTLIAHGAAEIQRRVLTPVPPVGQASSLSLLDGAGRAWRMFRYIEGTQTHATVQTPQQAERAARAFGEFQRSLADLPPPRLCEVIPGFHDTPARYAVLERVVAMDPLGRVKESKAEIGLALSHRELAPVLLDLHRAGAIPERVVHNDAKITNVLFDEATDQALCVVDLDTVMPGLSLYDFGDMARSMTCRAAEDERDLGQVQMDPTLFEAVARGYLAAMGDLITDAERAHLVTAARLITVEQGVRFLTDHILGDTYYGATRTSHNLDRCRTQFALAESMERRASELCRIIDVGA